jgi:hypothetical protein
VRPTPSRPASRRRPLNTSNVVFHDEDGSPRRLSKAAVEQAVPQLAEGKHVIDVADPYDRVVLP